MTIEDGDIPGFRYRLTAKYDLDDANNGVGYRCAHERVYHNLKHPVGRKVKIKNKDGKFYEANRRLVECRIGNNSLSSELVIFAQRAKRYVMVTWRKPGLNMEKRTSQACRPRPLR